MSGLMSLFGSQINLDSADLKYDPNKQKKQQAQNAQQSQYPVQAQCKLFHFDQATNENKSYGQVVLLVRPAPTGYVLMAYQQQNQPILNFQITPNVTWTLRDKIYAYLKDPQGRQWTLSFNDVIVAAKATIAMAAILSPIKDKQVATYDVLTGQGATVSNEDNVTVSYMGFLAMNLPFTGNMFDANERYNFVIGAGNVIKGYSIGVNGMKVGGSRVVLLPPEFAYGANQVGNKIPANATLSFLITLVDATVKNPQPAAPPPQPVQQEQPPPPPTQPQQPEQIQELPTHPAERRMSATLEKLQRAGTVMHAMPGMNVMPLSSPRAQDEPEESKQHKPLFENDDDDEDQPVVNTTFVPTIDEEDVLKRMDQLSELIKTRFDTLVLDTPISLKPRDLVYEIQNLASQIEDQERQLKEQEQLIDELKKSKQNSRLKAELDIAQTELQSLRSVLSSGKDYRRENDMLKAELRQLKETKIASLQENLAELRSQLANAHDISQAAAGTKTKELFFSFMGAAIDKLQGVFANNETLNAKQVTDKIYEVFHQCSEDVFKQIDERGII